MKLKFFLEHENSKLLQLYILQAVLIVSVFFLFFYSVGFTFFFALIAAMIGFLAIACLYRWLNLPFYILPKISGAVYIPTSDVDLDVMVKLAKVKHGDKSVDLGSGDGRVVAAFAKAGAKAVGLELNPTLVSKSEELLAEQKLTTAKIFWQSLWDVNLSEYDIVTVYGYPNLMKNLEKKLKAELKPGARVVSNQYPFPHWTPKKQQGKVFVYIQGS